MDNEQIRDALEAIVSLEESREREKRMRLETETLLEALRLVSSLDSIEDIFNTILQSLKSLINFDDAFVLRENEDNALIVIATTNPIFRHSYWKVGKLLDQVMFGQPVILSDISSCFEWNKQLPFIRENVESALHSPLLSDTSQAVLVCVNHRNDYFNSEHIKIIDRFSPLVSQALMNLHTKEELSKKNKHARLMVDRAESVSRNKSELLSSISREAQLPLNAIVSYANMLVHTNPNVEQQEYLEKIITSTDQLTRIAGDMKDISNLEMGIVDLDESAFSFDVLLQSVIETSSCYAKVKNLEISTVIDASVPDYLMGDSRRIRQVLYHLISVALDDSKSGNISLICEVKERSSQSVDLQFLIKDHVFVSQGDMDPTAPFADIRSFDDLSKYEVDQDGPNMSVSRLLAEAMGGLIWVEKLLGHGQIINFNLSLEYLPEDRVPTPEELVNEVHNNGQQVFVLVVDYSAKRRQQIKNLLAEWGVDCIAFSHESDAISYITDHKYDMNHQSLSSKCNKYVVVADTIATDLQHYKEFVKGLDIYTIYLVSEMQWQHSQTHRVHQASAFDFITSPIDFNRLKTLVSRHLDPTSMGVSDANLRDGFDDIDEPEKQLRLLLVDCPILDRSTLSDVMDGLGHIVMSLNLNTSTLETIALNHFDGIFLHIDSFDNDYWTNFLISLRESSHASVANIPLVLITDDEISDEKRSELHTSGVMEIVSRPFTLERIRSTLRLFWQSPTMAPIGKFRPLSQPLDNIPEHRPGDSQH